MLEKNKEGHKARTEVGRAQAVLGLKAVVIMNTSLHIIQVLPSRHMAGLQFLALLGSG